MGLGNVLGRIMSLLLCQTELQAPGNFLRKFRSDIEIISLIFSLENIKIEKVMSDKKLIAAILRYYTQISKRCQRRFDRLFPRPHSQEILKLAGSGRMAQFPESLSLDLHYALAGYFEYRAYLLKGPGISVPDSEAQP